MPDDEADWAAWMCAGRAGDGAAYARLLHAVLPALRRVVRARGRGLTREDHEDIVQDVLLAIHAKRHTWREDAPLKPWLWAIARHKVVDAYRARGAAIHLDVDDLADDLAAPAVEPTAPGDVGRLLGQIDARGAALVRDTALHDESAAEAGARHGMTEGAARVALHRAMKRLSALAGREDRG